MSRRANSEHNHGCWAIFAVVLAIVGLVVLVVKLAQHDAQRRDGPRNKIVHDSAAWARTLGGMPQEALAVAGKYAPVELEYLAPSQTDATTRMRLMPYRLPVRGKVIIWDCATHQVFAEAMQWLEPELVAQPGDQQVTVILMTGLGGARDGGVRESTSHGHAVLHHDTYHRSWDDAFCVGWLPEGALYGAFYVRHWASTYGTLKTAKDLPASPTQAERGHSFARVVEQMRDGTTAIQRSAYGASKYLP